MEDGTKMEQYAKNMYKYRMYARNYMIAICPYTQHWNLGRKIRLIPTRRVYKKVYKRKKAVFTIEAPSKWQSHKESNFICQFDNKSSYFLNFQHLVEL